MKKRIAMMLLVLSAMLCCALASAQEDAPGEVLAHIEANWPGHELFDYVEVKDTPQGDYGFALLSRGKEKLLVGYKDEDGQMRYFLKNAAAVPQGEGISYAQWMTDPQQTKDVFALSLLSEHDVKNIDGNRIIGYGDRLGFSVARMTPDAERGMENRQSVVYHWENGAFRLSEYRNDDIWYGPVFVSEQQLDFYRGEWEFAGTVLGEFQRELAYASLAAMPKTLDEAREKLSLPPTIPTGLFSDLTAKEIKFTGGRKYDVYSGPGEDYARSGNGKGSVSTNDWIQVFGEEDDWIMIQYDISSDRFRIGYISADALPAGADAAPLLWENAGRAYAVGETEMTDDPLGSRTKTARINSGERFAWLGAMGDWAYIEIERDGLKQRGFVRADHICMEPFAFDETAKNLLTEVYGYTAKEADEDFQYYFYEQNRGVYAVFHLKAHPDWAYSYWQNKATGEIVDAKSPFATGYEGYPGEGTVRLELSRREFASTQEVEDFFVKYYGPKSGWPAALEGWCDEVKREVNTIF